MQVQWDKTSRMRGVEEEYLAEILALSLDGGNPAEAECEKIPGASTIRMGKDPERPKKDRANGI